MSEPRPDGKPFAISKRLVFEAWRRVKANRGACGIDEESIQAVEVNLQGNLGSWRRSPNENRGCAPTGSGERGRRPG